LAVVHYQSAVQSRCQEAKAVEISWGAPNYSQQISAVSGPKFTISWGHVEEILLFNTFFRLSIYALVAKIQPDNLYDGAEMAIFCVIFASCIFSELRAAHF